MMWREAPITAAIVIAGILSAHSRTVGMAVGTRRLTEVNFGCVVALEASWLMARLWSMRETKAEPDGTVDKTEALVSVGTRGTRVTGLSLSPFL